MVVGAVDDVAEVELAVGLGAVEMNLELTVTVVEDELIVALAVEGLAAKADDGSAVAVIGITCSSAMPDGTITTHEVALGGGD